MSDSEWGEWEETGASAPNVRSETEDSEWGEWEDVGISKPDTYDISRIAELEKKRDEISRSAGRGGIMGGSVSGSVELAKINDQIAALKKNRLDDENRTFSFRGGSLKDMEVFEDGNGEAFAFDYEKMKKGEDPRIPISMAEYRSITGKADNWHPGEQFVSKDKMLEDKKIRDAESARKSGYRSVSKYLEERFGKAKGRVDVPAEFLPAIVDEESKSELERLNAAEGRNIEHVYLPMHVVRDENGKIAGYMTTNSTVVPESDTLFDSEGKGHYSVIPTIRGSQGHTVEMTEDEAREYYRLHSGKKFGTFASKEEAEKAAQDIHNLHQRIYQQKWNQYLNEHWDEVSDEIKADPGTAAAHMKWIEAGSPMVSYDAEKERERIRLAEEEAKAARQKRKEELEFRKKRGTLNESESEELAWLSGEKRERSIAEDARWNLQAETGERNDSTAHAIAAYMLPGYKDVLTDRARSDQTRYERYLDGEYSEDDLKFDPELASVVHNTLGGEEAKKDAIRHYGYEMLANVNRAKDEAKASLQNTKLSWYKRPVTGGIQNTGYTLNFALSQMIGGGVGGILIPATIAAHNRYGTLTSNEYGFGENGELIISELADSATEAGAKAIIGGLAEAAVERYLEVLGAPIAKSALAKTVRGKVMRKLAEASASGNKVTRTIPNIVRGYGKLAKFTGVNSAPWEVLEEDAQAILDEVIGLENRRDSRSGLINGGSVREAWSGSDQLSWKGQLDVFLSMLGTMAFQAGIGGVIDHYVNKDARNELKKHAETIYNLPIDRKYADAMSDREKAKFVSIYNKYANNPDKLAEAANRMFGKNGVLEIALRNVQARGNAEAATALAEVGERPAKFAIPTNEKGEVAFVPQVIFDSSTGKRVDGKMALDNANNIGIVDCGDGRFIVVDFDNGKQYSHSSLKDAKDAADGIILARQVRAKQAEMGVAPQGAETSENAPADAPVAEGNDSQSEAAKPVEAAVDASLANKRAELRKRLENGETDTPEVLNLISEIGEAQGAAEEAAAQTAYEDDLVDQLPAMEARLKEMDANEADKSSREYKQLVSDINAAKKIASKRSEVKVVSRTETPTPTAAGSSEAPTPTKTTENPAKFDKGTPENAEIVATNAGKTDKRDISQKPKELPTDNMGVPIGNVGDIIELENGMTAELVTRKNGSKKWKITRGKRWTTDGGKTWHDGLKPGDRFKDDEYDTDKVPANAYFGNQKSESGIWEVDYVRRDGSYELKPVPVEEKKDAPSKIEDRSPTIEKKSVSSIIAEADVPIDDSSAKSLGSLLSKKVDFTDKSRAVESQRKIERDFNSLAEKIGSPYRIEFTKKGRLYNPNENSSPDSFGQFVILSWKPAVYRLEGSERVVVSKGRVFTDPDSISANLEEARRFGKRKGESSVDTTEKKKVAGSKDAASSPKSGYTPYAPAEKHSQLAKMNESVVVSNLKMADEKDAKNLVATTPKGQQLLDDAFALSKTFREQMSNRLAEKLSRAGEKTLEDTVDEAGHYITIADGNVPQPLKDAFAKAQEKLVGLKRTKGAMSGSERSKATSITEFAKVPPEMGGAMYDPDIEQTLLSGGFFNPPNRNDVLWDYVQQHGKQSFVFKPQESKKTGGNDAKIIELAERLGFPTEVDGRGENTGAVAEKIIDAAFAERERYQQWKAEQDEEYRNNRLANAKAEVAEIAKGKRKTWLANASKADLDDLAEAQKRGEFDEDYANAVAFVEDGADDLDAAIVSPEMLKIAVPLWDRIRLDHQRKSFLFVDYDAKSGIMTIADDSGTGDITKERIHYYEVTDNGFKEVENGSRNETGASQPQPANAQEQGRGGEAKPRQHDNRSSGEARRKHQRRYGILAGRGEGSIEGISEAVSALKNGEPIRAIDTDYSISSDDIREWQDSAVGEKIGSREDAAHIFMRLSNPTKEIPKVLYVAKDGTVIKASVHGVGTLGEARMDQRKVIDDAPDGCYGVIVSHNHPDGDVNPSKQDMLWTLTLLKQDSGDIKIIDNIVTDTDRFVSIAEGSEEWKPIEGLDGSIYVGKTTIPLPEDRFNIVPYDERLVLTKPLADGSVSASKQLLPMIEKIASVDKNGSYVILMEGSGAVNGIVSIPKDVSKLTDMVRGSCRFAVLVGTDEISRKDVSDALDAAVDYEGDAARDVQYGIIYSYSMTDGDYELKTGHRSNEEFVKLGKPVKPTTEKSSEVSKTKATALKKTPAKKSVSTKKPTGENAKKAADALARIKGVLNADIARLEQRFTSAKTSLPKNEPSLYKSAVFQSSLKRGGQNLDIGAGRAEYATKLLAEKGVKNATFDPFNRPQEVNARIIRDITSGKRFNTVTAANVLNVIAEPEVRDNVILEAAKAVSPNGRVFFDVYTAPRAGEVKGRDSFQTGMKPQEYIPEIEKHFGKVERSGSIIVASSPKVSSLSRKATWWDANPTLSGNTTLYSPIEDTELRQLSKEEKRELRNATEDLVEALGGASFDEVARYIADADPALYRKFKPFLKNAYNSATDGDLTTVQANEIYDKIDADLKEIDNDNQTAQQPADKLRGKEGDSREESLGTSGGRRDVSSPAGELGGGRIRGGRGGVGPRADADRNGGTEGGADSKSPEAQPRLGGRTAQSDGLGSNGGVNRPVGGSVAGQGGASDIQSAGGLDEVADGREEVTPGFMAYDPPADLPVKAPKSDNLIVETSALASVNVPPIVRKPDIDDSIPRDGILQAHQYQAVCQIVNAYEQTLPSGERTGYLVADGTGSGKTRIIAGVMLDAVNRKLGGGKAVMISQNRTLFNDALKDFTPFGISNRLFELDKYGKDSPTRKRSTGIAFTTYNNLSDNYAGIGRDGEVKSTNKRGKADSRFGDLVKWLGKDFDGVIALDEVHTASKERDGRTSKQASYAQTVIDFQATFPKARVVYLTATAAYNADDLRMLTRLGIWGKGTGFDTRNDFVSAADRGGMSMLEVLTQGLKARGLYCSRSISFKGVECKRVVHKLTDQQVAMYNQVRDTLARVFSAIHQAGGMCGLNGKEMSLKSRNFFGAAQNLINTMVTSFKTQTAIDLGRQALKDGKSPVFQLVTTNDAAKAFKAEEARRSQSLELISDGEAEQEVSVKDNIIKFISGPTFPTREFLGRKKGAGAEWGSEVPKAVALQKEMLALARQLPDIGNPIDVLVKEFSDVGISKVKGGMTKNVRVAEVDKFNNGTNLALVFSGAGGTGSSYHADRRFKNQRQRVQIPIEFGWEPDKFIQALGRSHRNNQVVAPEFMLLSTDLAGENRFMSTIASRVSSMGAIVGGDRNSSGQVISESDSLENKYGRAAVRDFADRVKSGAGYAGLSSSEILNEMYLDADKLDELTVKKFLARLLFLSPDQQNTIYGELMDKVDAAIAKAKEDGTYDNGIRRIDAKRVEIKNRESMSTGDNASQNRDLLTVGETYPSKRVTLDELRKRIPDTSRLSLMRNKRSKEVYAVIEGRNRTLRYSPNGSYEEIDALDLQNYEAVDRKTGETEWQKKYDAIPETRELVRHYMTGDLIPVWNKMGIEHPQVYRAQPYNARPFIGVFIPDNDLPSTLYGFGFKDRARQIFAENAFKDISRSTAITYGIGETEDAAMQPYFRNAKIGGQKVLAVIGAGWNMELLRYLDNNPNFQSAWYQDKGNYNDKGGTVYYIPFDAEGSAAEDAFEGVMGRFGIVKYANGKVAFATKNVGENGGRPKIADSDGDTSPADTEKATALGERLGMPKMRFAVDHGKLVIYGSEAGKRDALKRAFGGTDAVSNRGKKYVKSDLRWDRDNGRWTIPLSDVPKALWDEIGEVEDLHTPITRVEQLDAETIRSLNDNADAMEATLLSNMLRADIVPLERANSGLSDKLLAQRAADDPSALGELYRRYMVDMNRTKGGLSGIVNRICAKYGIKPNTQLVEDVAAQVWSHPTRGIVREVSERPEVYRNYEFTTILFNKAQNFLKDLLEQMRKTGEVTLDQPNRADDRVDDVDQLVADNPDMASRLLGGYAADEQFFGRVDWKGSRSREESITEARGVLGDIAYNLPDERGEMLRAMLKRFSVGNDEQKAVVGAAKEVGKPVGVFRNEWNTLKDLIRTNKYLLPENMAGEFEGAAYSDEELMDMMPEAMANAVELRLQGMDAKQIAEKLGVSRENVTEQLRRAVANYGISYPRIESSQKQQEFDFGGDNKPAKPGAARKHAKKPKAAQNFVQDTLFSEIAPLEGGISQLYTGSAADYEKPSLHHVGTGEGSQVYGWGLYASDQRGVAESYMRASDYGDKEVMFGLKGVDYTELNDEQCEAYNALIKAKGDREKAREIIKGKIDLLFYGLPKEWKGQKKYLNGYDKVESFDTYHKALDEVDRIADRAKYVQFGTLYEQTFFTNRAPGDESHLLKWYEPVSEENWNRILDQGEKEKGDDFLFMLDEQRTNGENASDIYNGLVRIFGSPQAASEFLARADIDGIKYPVDSYGGKTVKDGDKAGWNYVSFRDDNITVDHKWVDGVQLYSAVEPLETIQAEIPDMIERARLYGMHNAAVDEFRKANGMPEIGRGRKMTREQILAPGEAMANNEIEMEKLVSLHLANPKLPANADTQAAFTVYGVRLAGRITNLKDGMAEAVANGNMPLAEQLQAELDESMVKYDRAAKASRNIGTQWAYAGLARQGKFSPDMSYAEYVTAMNKAAGGKPSEKQKRVIEAVWNELHDKNIAVTDSHIRDIVRMIDESLVPAWLSKTVTDSVKRRRALSLERIEEGYFEALRQARHHGQMTGGVLDGLPNGQKWIRAMIAYYVNSGVDIYDENGKPDNRKVVPLLQKDLEDCGINATPYEIRQMESRMGNATQPSKDETSVMLRDLHAQMLVEQQIAYMTQFGELPPKTGWMRDKDSDIARRLRKERLETEKRLGLDSAKSERRLASLLDAAKTRVRNQIADIDEKIRILENGGTLPQSQTKPGLTPDEELLNLRSQLKMRKEILAGLDAEGEHEKKVIRVLKALKRRAEALRERNDAAKENPTEDKFDKSEREKLDDPRIDAARKEIADLNKEFDDFKASLFPEGTQKEQGVWHARRMNALAKSLDRWNAALNAYNSATTWEAKNKALHPIVRKPPKDSEETLKAKKNRDAAYRKVQDLRNKLERENTRGGQLMAAFKLASSAPALLRTVGDMSVALVQGGRGLNSHPILWSKALAAGTAALFRKSSADKLVEGLKSHPYFDDFKDHGGHVYSMEGLEDGDIPEDFRILGERVNIQNWPLVKQSARGFSGFLNHLNLSLYQAMVESAGNGNGGANDNIKRDIAKFVNITTGYGYEKKTDRKEILGVVANILDGLAWAPRKAIAELKYATGLDMLEPYWGSRRSEKSAKDIRRAIGVIGKEKVRFTLGMIAYTIAATLIGNMLGGENDWEELLNPLSTDFLRPKIGNTRLRPAAGLEIVWRTLARLITGKTNSNGVTKEADRGEVLARFVRGKLTPWIATAWDFFTGRTATGRDVKTSPGEFVKNYVLPLTWASEWDNFAMNDPISAVATLPLIFYGGSAYTAETDILARADAQRKDLDSRIEALKNDGTDDELKAELSAKKKSPQYKAAVYAEKVVKLEKKRSDAPEKLADLRERLSAVNDEIAALRKRGLMPNENLAKSRAKYEKEIAEIEEGISKLDSAIPEIRKKAEDRVKAFRWGSVDSWRER